jgi:hypothetical protein
MKYIKSFLESYEYGKITIQDVFDLIDYSDWRNLYPDYKKEDTGFGDEYMFETKEKAYQYAEFVADVFNSFDNEIEIYRCIIVNDISQIDYENPGEYWSFDRESAINFGKRAGSGILVLLTGKIKAIDVDWKKSVKTFICFSNNGTDEDENELFVNEYKVYDVKTEILRNKKVKKLNENFSLIETSKFKLNGICYQINFYKIKFNNISFYERSYGSILDDEFLDDQLNLSYVQLLKLLTKITQLTINFINNYKPDILKIGHKNMDNENEVDDDKLNKRAKLNYRFLKESIPNNYNIEYYSNNNFYSDAATTCFIYKKGIDISGLTENKIKINQ